MSDALEERIAFGKKFVETQIPVFDGLFGNVESEWKYDGSRVTEADLKLSKNFEEGIRAAFPSDQFFSEEQTEEDAVEVKKGYPWMVDPIDGTNNFARGIPTCSISLALLKDGDPVYGYIYDYSLRELLHGGSDKGVFRNDLNVSVPVFELSCQSIISNQGSSKLEFIKDDMALQAYFKLRCCGSSAIQIAYVAMGFMDGVVAHSIKSWDIAAGVAMLRAAGMDYVPFDEDPFPVKRFSAKMKGFGYAAGPKPVIAKAMELMGR